MEDDNEQDIWPTAEERAANIAQATRLKEAALAGGLRFEAYLPPNLAVWLLEMIERGKFNDPNEAAYLIFGEARELQPHADLRKELLRRMIQSSVDDPRPSLSAEEATETLWKSIEAPRGEPAVWNK